MGAFTDDDEKILRDNIEIRQKLTRFLLENDELVKSADDRKFLLDLLKANDQTVISRAKVKSDDKSNASSANMQTAMADFFKSLGRDRKNKSNLTIDERELTLPDNIEPEVVEGNMVIGNDAMTYAEFLTKNKTE